MLRSSAAIAISKVAGALPRTVRKALLNGVLDRDGDYSLFQELGRKYGVEDIRISGNYGMIEGSIDDGALLPAYGRTKSWAAASNALFTDFFSRRGGGTYVDVGANVGLTTIPIAQNAAVACKAVEPEPAAFAYLAANVARNCRGRNVELFNIAALDRAALVDFELSEMNMGDHRVRLHRRPGRWHEQRRAVIKVPADCLDDILDADALAPPIALKVDTQGAEAHVFDGARRHLARAELVAFEYWPYGIRRMAGDTASLAALVVQHFAEGSIGKGDEGLEPQWAPTASVAQRLLELAKHGEDPYPYFDVLLRK